MRLDRSSTDWSNTCFSTSLSDFWRLQHQWASCKFDMSDGCPPLAIGIMWSIQADSGCGYLSVKSTGLPHIPHTVCVAYIRFLFARNCCWWAPLRSGLSIGKGFTPSGSKFQRGVQKDTPPESGVPLRKFTGGVSKQKSGAAHKVMPSVAARDLRPVNHMKGDSSKKSKSVLSYCPQFKL